MKHLRKTAAVRAALAVAVLVATGAMASATTQSFDFGNSSSGGNNAMPQFFGPSQFSGFGGGFSGLGGGFSGFGGGFGAPGFFPAGAPFMMGGAASGFFPGGATNSFFSGSGFFGGFGAFSQGGSNDRFGFGTASNSTSKNKKKNKNKNKKKNAKKNDNKKHKVKAETKPDTDDFCLHDCGVPPLFDGDQNNPPVVGNGDPGDNHQPGVVPLPAGGPLLIGGLAALAFLRRRRKA